MEQRLIFPDLSPEFVSVRSSSAETYRHLLPAILKPTDGGGKTGVRQTNNLEQLRTALSERDSSRDFLLERFVQGDEYSVEALVQGGRIIFQSITKRGAESLVGLSHTIPGCDLAQETSVRLLATHGAILRKISFADGIAHSEFKIDPSGKIFLIEINARNPGAGLMPLYHLATGNTMEDAIVSVALGLPTTYSPLRRICRQRFFGNVKGQLRSVKYHGEPRLEPTHFGDTNIFPTLTPLSPDSGGRLHAILVDKAIGSETTVATNSFERTGSVLIDGRTLQEVDTVDETVQRNLDVVIDPT